MPESQTQQDKNVNFNKEKRFKILTTVDLGGNCKDLRVGFKETKINLKFEKIIKGKKRIRRSYSFSNSHRCLFESIWTASNYERDGDPTVEVPF